MNLRETLVLSSLKFKALHSGSDNVDLVDALLDQNPQEADKITRNVCARVPLELSDKMQAIGSILGLNKREIITLGVIEFIRQAEETLEEFDAFPEDTGEARVLAVQVAK